MLSDEEKISLNRMKLFARSSDLSVVTAKDMDIVVTLIEKQQKEIEELKETLKCTQNSWYEDTQKIEEMKKQINLDDECEIALNNKIIDLEKEIEELKEDNKHQWEERCKLTFELENSTSNDKIKAKIEELKEDIKYSANPLSIDNSKFGIKVLQSLLEKE